MVSLAAIREAAQILQGRIIRTPLVSSPTFSAMTDTRVYLKLECMQKAGSFKVRGASNRILSERGAIGENGVIAASAGNHAQGVAVAASTAGVPATIVMPEWVSPSKQEATAGYGAKIILKGKSLQESIDHAIELAASGEMTFIHPYNDEAVIAGQGTIGLEILEDLPEVDCVIAPIGGGGLIAGIATVVKELRPEARVIGVQAEACESATAALRHGGPVTVDSDPTIADGIRVTRVGDLAFPFIRDRVDGVVTVSDRDIVRAITLLLERKKVLAEGAGAAPLAALLAGKVPVDAAEKVAVVISGGNVDAFLFERVLRLGLFDSGRILQCTVELEEGPRSFPALFSLVTWEGGVITRIEQERASPDLPLYLSRVTLEMEVRSQDHQQRMLNALRDAGYTVIAQNPPEDLSHGFYHSMERG
jgi:threonine dehydratase